MKTETALAVGLGVGGVLLLALAYLVPKAGQAVASAGQAVAQATGGLVTGENPVTASATNSMGESVTAYYGAGFVGTVGAATNAASGGVLASVGQWIGAKAWDLFNDDPMVVMNHTARP